MGRARCNGSRSRLLVERGRAESRLALAKLYEKGNATLQPDWVHAYVLYAIAARTGMEDADRRMRSLASMMPVEQWQEARDIIQQLEMQGTLVHEA